MPRPVHILSYRTARRRTWSARPGIVSLLCLAASVLCFVFLGSLMYRRVDPAPLEVVACVVLPLAAFAAIVGVVAGALDYRAFHSRLAMLGLLLNLTVVAGFVLLTVFLIGSLSG